MSDSILDLDALLDCTLDDLEDLPSFKPFPIGVHRVLATLEQKKIGDKDAIELNFKYIECIELGNTQDEQPKEGDTANTMFMLDNKWGLGELKKCAQPFAEALQLGSIREVIDGVKEVECVIVTGLRVDKNDSEKVYMKVKEIQVV